MISASAARTKPGLVLRTRALAAVAGACCLLGLGGAARAEVKWGLFSHVDYVAASHENSAFVTESVNFFATGSIAPNIHVLAENVLEVLDGELHFDLERIHLDYVVADALTVRAGRYHMPLGYYGTAYHHALLFQLTTHRPVLVNFEDEGGLLPAHMIGLELFGRIAQTDSIELRYDVGVGNGRGQHSDDVLSTSDRNEFKSVVAKLLVRSPRLHGFEAGVSGYLDRIPGGFTDPDTGMVLLPESLDELILGAHATYQRHPFRALAEGYYVRHAGRTSGDVSRLLGGFAQLGVTVYDRYTPYVHVEHVDHDDDIFYTVSGSPSRVLDFRVGLSTSLAATAVLKAEYSYEDEADRHLGTMQLAFGF